MAHAFFGTTRTTRIARAAHFSHDARTDRTRHAAHSPLRRAWALPAQLAVRLEMLGCALAMALVAALALTSPSFAGATSRAAAADAASGSRTIGVGEARSTQAARESYVAAKLGQHADATFASVGSDRPALEAGDWYETVASAYSVACNDGGTATASGVPLDDVTPTVASPWLPLGSVVEVWYGDACVVATVTDRGPYVSGRELDLSPATYQALGAASSDEWGVRCVSYRVVG